MNEDEPVVSAVMPCLNEAETLQRCIEKAWEGIRSTGLKGEVVIADNGSSDGSPEIAERAGARVVRAPMKGYGAALLSGIRSSRGKYIVMADADDSYDWTSIPQYVNPLLKDADVVMGNRFKGGIEPGAMPLLHRYLGNPVLTTLARFVYQIPVGDFHCGMRSFTRPAFDKMRLQTTGMEFATEMIVRASRARLSIVEVPTRLSPDGRSRPPHLRSFRDGWRHLRFIITYAPNYLYLIPGAFALVVGLGLMGMLALGPLRVQGVFLGPHFLAAGCLLVLSGIMAICLGIVARVAVWLDYPIIHDRVVKWLLGHFSPEIPVASGALLALLGGGVWGVLLWQYLLAPAPMESSIHLAFVASTLVAVGLVIIFGSFLVHLLLQHSRKLRHERDSYRPPPEGSSR